MGLGRAHVQNLTKLGLALVFTVAAAAGCSKMPVNENTVFLPADSAGWLEPDELVLGLVYGGEIRAYPIPALSPIEVLNDVVGETPVVVTWCPLSATGAVFNSASPDGTRRFRFYPDLYFMNLLFEDVETESVWSQLASRAVEGTEGGTPLELLPAVQTSWGAWRAAHPETTVLRPDWERGRFSYRTPEERESPDDPAAEELVLAVTRGDASRAYAFHDLAQAGAPVTDVLGDQPVTVQYQPEGPTAFATDAAGDVLPSVVLYWKYMGDFFPDLEVWSPGRRP